MTLDQGTKRMNKVTESVWLGCFAVVVILMLYGVFRHPFAPIRFRQDAYYDKVGHKFTETQFRNFKIWERCFWISFSLLGVASVPLALSQWRRSRP